MTFIRHVLASLFTRSRAWFSHLPSTKRILATISLVIVAFALAPPGLACEDEQLAGVELGKPLSLMQRLQRKPFPNAELLGNLGGRQMFLLSAKGRSYVRVSLDQDDVAFFVESHREFESDIAMRDYFSEQSAALAKIGLELHPSPFDKGRNQSFIASNATREVTASVQDREVQWGCSDVQLAKRAADRALEDEISEETEKNKKRVPELRVPIWQIRSRQSVQEANWAEALAIYEAARKEVMDDVETRKLNKAWLRAQQGLANRLVKDESREVAINTLSAAAQDERWLPAYRLSLWPTVVAICIRDATANFPADDWTRPLSQALAIPALPTEDRAGILLFWQDHLITSKRYDDALQKGMELRSLPGVSEYYQSIGRVRDALARARIKNDSVQLVAPRPITAYTRPVYPRKSMRNGKEGTVDVDMLINSRGDIAKVFVSHTSGDFELDNAAISSMQSLSFIPATLDNQAIEMMVRKTVKFELE